MRDVIEATLRTPEKFRGWLTGKSEGTVVGTVGSSHDCPLARFLREMGVQDAEIGIGHIFWTSGVNGTGSVPLALVARWGVLFVCNIDSIDKGVFIVPVTAGRCLSVLEKCVAILVLERV